MAAGLLAVWSTIRLEMMRGSASTTSPGWMLARDGRTCVRGDDAIVRVRQNLLTGAGRSKRNAVTIGIVGSNGGICAGEQLAGGAVAFLAGCEVVVGAVDAAQTPGKFGVGKIGAQELLAARIRLGDLDLSEDEIEVAADHRDHSGSPWALSVKTRTG